MKLPIFSFFLVCKDFIRKHIVNHFYRYVRHLDDENIEKTSNKSKITTDKLIPK